MKEKYEHDFFAVLLLVVSMVDLSHGSFQPPKQEYIVGGSSADTADVFVKKWRLLLQTYLTNVVGTKYNPPITFKLLLVDYDATTRAQQFAAQGLMDFVCKFTSFIYHFNRR